jgi:hypothetical protein
MNGRYILIGQTPVPCEDLFEWGRWMQNADRVVLSTTVGEWRVSTVFLGLDHQLGDGGPPILFETMIFLTAAERRPNESLDDLFRRIRPLEEAADQELVGYQRRYSDWIAAESGHEAAVRLVEERTGTARADQPDWKEAAK